MTDYGFFAGGQPDDDSYYVRTGSFMQELQHSRLPCLAKLAENCELLRRFRQCLTRRPNGQQQLSVLEMKAYDQFKSQRAGFYNSVLASFDGILAHPFEQALQFARHADFFARLEGLGGPAASGEKRPENVLTLLDLQPFQFQIPSAYFSSAFRIALTNYSNVALPFITLNEFPLLLTRCYRFAKDVCESLMPLLTLGATAFFQQLIDNVCAPHVSPFSVVVDFLKKYEHCTPCSASQYFLDSAAPLLQGELQRPACDLLRLCIIMLVNGFSLRTFKPRQAALAELDFGNQHFSFEYYVSNLDEDETQAEPLETLMGYNEYQVFLNEVADDSRVCIIYPAVYQNDTLCEKGRVEAQVKMQGQFCCDEYVACQFFPEALDFDDCQLAITPRQFDISGDAIRKTISECRASIAAYVQQKQKALQDYEDLCANWRECNYFSASQATLTAFDDLLPQSSYMSYNRTEGRSDMYGAGFGGYGFGGGLSKGYGGGYGSGRSDGFGDRYSSGREMGGRQRGKFNFDSAYDYDDDFK